jgi:hypothetical protein
MSAIVSTRGSFDECNMTGLLEDLKFFRKQEENTNGSSSPQEQATSSSSKKATASGPSKSDQSPQRLSFKKQVRTRLRGSFQRKTSKCSSRSFEPRELDIPFFDNDLDDSSTRRSSPPPKCENSQNEKMKRDRGVKLMWMTDSELV